MTRTHYLDQGVDSEVASNVIESLEEAGYSVEEMIPGLILAVILLSESTAFPEAALDEAANLLADGPSENEVF